MTDRNFRREVARFIKLIKSIRGTPATESFLAYVRAAYKDPAGHGTLREFMACCWGQREWADFATKFYVYRPYGRAVAAPMFGRATLMFISPFIVHAYVPRSNLVGGGVVHSKLVPAPSCQCNKTTTAQHL